MSVSEFTVRKEKVSLLRKAGINPYCTHYTMTHSIASLRELSRTYNFPPADLLMSDGAAPTYSIAWRVMMYRTHGKLSFATLRDGSDDIQLAFVRWLTWVTVFNQRQETVFIADETVDAAKFIEKYIDVGDFIGVCGELFLTKHGELTLFVHEMTLLTKALRPLWDKRHGIENIELRLRKRYLDTTMNRSVHAMLKRRSLFWQTVRQFLLRNDFMEVETPILEVTTWGADAHPFSTHHQALDLDVFLRISCGELWQKRLMIGGFEKTFEIGRVFRNEGMSPEHAQDYTQMENYRAYADYRQMMTLVKDMYTTLVDTVYNKRQFTIRWYDVDFDWPWPEIDYTTIIKEMTSIDIWHATDSEIITKLQELHVSYDPLNRQRLLDTLWKYCRKQISGPAFLVNVPKMMSPLAKVKADNPDLTERFQVIIAWSEMGNWFSELNDPVDQYERFVDQQAMRDAWDDEAQMADREYVEALEHGMPPTAWFGFSERFFCFLEDLPIREAQYFPLMRPLSSEQAERDDENQ
jgi:lysyl-tRNA synthetase class 2